MHTDTYQHHTSSIVAAVMVAILFFGATIASQLYASRIESVLTDAGSQSMFTYVLITATGTVLAPISTVPLIPLVAPIWGWILTGTLSIIGWVLGSQIAFLLARRYGTPLVGRFIPLKKIATYEQSLSTPHLFWTVVLLRLTVPVDVLSYALGLFSTMSAKTYLLATTIGVTPFAFIFAYTGTLSFRIQIGFVSLLAVVLGSIYLYQRRFRTK